MKTAVAGMLLTALVLCVFPGVHDTEAEQITLVIMAPWAAEELEGFKPVMEEFEKRNPHIKLEYRSGKPEDTSTILANQFAVKKTPVDVVDTPWQWYIIEQAKKGHVMDLTDVIDPSDFLPGAIERVKFDDKIYAASSLGGVTTPEYRKSFFQKNNLTAPKDVKDWDEFIALLDKIKTIPGIKSPLGSGGGVGWPFTSIVENWIVAFGGTDMHKGLTNGTISWQSPEVKAVLRDKLLPLLQNDYFGEPDEFEAVLNAMWAGDHAIYIGDSTDSMSVSPAEDRGIFLLPGQEGVVFWHDYWFVPQYTKHPEEAKRLLSFLATEGQAIQIRSGGRVSTYAKVPASDYPAPEREVFQAIEGKTVLPDMDDTIGGKFQATIWDQLGLLWASPTEETLDAVLAELQRASEETLAKN
ncbi:ABC transporter substrate-binding protein [candidate division KSB3 bacterium]|uniref:ABC transporter substrate-binding protein n=1 Tax=candidate division KSB3 bacterium TaxID=2044937 RepID=A0A2G6E6R5_9BACT|nr:MAG: ABC transporter substrate-binding protein [candidate division KSB3 bacterium]PIE30160.1 MAG: ABC transporter substrate-binding protein [candidate division KSB3 bacterium]